MQITWLSYFGSVNQGLPLRSWFVTCWLWRHIPIVTSLAVPSSCVVMQTPMGTNSGTRSRKRKFPLLFVNCDRGRIEIDHLYGLRWSGWYCNPEQHELCRPSWYNVLMLTQIFVVTGHHYRNWPRYGLRWSGWYCNPEQHELCRPSWYNVLMLTQIFVVTGHHYRNWPRYGLCWSGWYCNPEQHELCRPSRGRFL